MRKYQLAAPLLIAIALTIPTVEAMAQCTMDYLSASSNWITFLPGNGSGQSFTACATGFVTRVSLNTGPSYGNCNFKIVAGTDILTAPNNQVVSFNQGFNTISLDPPFPVTDGLTYSFGIFPTVHYLSIYRDITNPYAEGGELYAYTDHVVENPGWDLAFGLDIMTEPVPTQSSTWGAVKKLYR